ncbi:MAG: hypothetical protein FWH27_09220 [Planctomycetaceae bacterium]|nr:hypothetical protein [Planctomycetaceae bacterium]
MNTIKSYCIQTIVTSKGKKHGHSKEKRIAPKQKRMTSKQKRAIFAKKQARKTGKCGKIAKCKVQSAE